MPTSPEPAEGPLSVQLWLRAQTILADALDLEPGQRRGHVHQHCGHDPELRDYVNLLIDRAEPSTDWLERSPVLTPEPASLLQPGELLAGRFEIVRPLGRGGMSEVYHVLDRFSAESQALKVLLPELAGQEQTVLRIKHEIQLARRVTHVNVCRLHDVFRHEDATRFPSVLHFFTMELLDGPTLGAHLHETGPMTRAAVLELMRPIAAGLSAAHAAGVVHRDLKPGNIMLAAEPGGPARVVITDFGMAVPASENAPRLLAKGDLIGGTPRYMAPEQFRTDTATPATDVFALGVILHELLTGHTPFTASRLTQLVNRSAATARDGEPHMDSALNPCWARAILRCLEPLPENRFQSVNHLLAALEPLRPVLLRRTLVATGICAVAAAAAYPLLTSRQDDPLAGTSSEEARAAFSRASLQGKRLTTDELLKSVHNYEEAIRLDPKFAEAHAGVAECYGRIQDYGGLPFREAASKAQAAAGQAIRLKPGLAVAHGALGLSLSLDVDRWRLAEASFRRAFELRQDYPSAHHWLGVHLARLGQTGEAVGQLRVALRLDPASLPVVNALGWMLYFDRQYDAAMKAALSTVDLDPNYFYSHLLLARCHAELRQYPRALEMCQAAAALSARGALGAVLPIPAVVVSAQTCILAASGAMIEARARFEDLLTLRKSGYIPAHYIATAHCMLGGLLPALDVMERAWADRDPGVLYLRLYPHFRVLRGQPRYNQLLAALGFPAGDAAARAQTATG